MCIASLRKVPNIFVLLRACPALLVRGRDVTTRCVWHCQCTQLECTTAISCKTLPRLQVEAKVVVGNLDPFRLRGLAGAARLKPTTLLLPP